MSSTLFLEIYPGNFRVLWKFEVKYKWIVHDNSYNMVLIEQGKIEEADTKFINLNRILKKYTETELSSKSSIKVMSLKQFNTATANTRS